MEGLEELQSSNKIAKFDESVNQLIRINTILNSCREYSCSGKLIQWKWQLDAFWRELSADATRLDNAIKKEADKYYRKKDLINNKIASAIDNIQLYNALNEKEEFLRGLQNSVGKGAGLKDEDEDGFD